MQPGPDEYAEALGRVETWAASIAGPIFDELSRSLDLDDFDEQGAEALDLALAKAFLEGYHYGTIEIVAELAKKGINVTLPRHPPPA